MSIMLKTLQWILDESVKNENNIPFNNFITGGKEDDTFHTLNIEWNGRFIDVEGDVIQDSIIFKYKDVMFLMGNISKGWLNDRLIGILDTLFPLPE